LGSVFIVVCGCTIEVALPSAEGKTDETPLSIVRGRYFHELGELASEFFTTQPDGDAQELADRILDLTLDRGAKTPGYGIGPRTGGLRKEDAVRRPGWDDVALQVIHLRVPQVALPPPPQPQWGAQAEGTEAQPPPVPMDQASSGSVEC
jgi:hypothetical protein